MQKLPLGLQSFKKLREQDCLYVDKTEVIFNLIQARDYYFLSRPRRFGKSLLVSTLKNLFQGNKALFKGLWIEDKWDWTQKYPVLHFSFNQIGHQDIGFREALESELDSYAKEFQIELDEKGIARKFRQLIREITRKSKVVILIDEYDKPVIDYIGGEEDKAEANIQTLKSFYSILKNSDIHIKFLFITGVSKFSKVGIFSDLKNLSDISLSPHSGGICGYTENELREYFAKYCPTIPTEAFWQKVKKWYNGYTWDLKTYVYNPFSILSYFNEGEFSNFWFQSGTPTFLIKLLKKHFFYDFENIAAGRSTFESYDFQDISTVPLLFQTGYLTLTEKNEIVYKLGYPNHEVKESMLQHLIKAFRHSKINESSAIVYDIRNAFLENRIDKVISSINTVFSTIPSQIFMAEKERYYHSLVHLTFSLLGIYIESEVNTNRGRIDAVVHTQSHIYILEFKLNKTAEEAIEQIKTRNYPQKFQNSGKTILGIGINFSSKTKDVQAYKTITF